ncbi:MAG: BON domain-containing protein [Nodosilinea sp.]
MITSLECLVVLSGAAVVLALITVMPRQVKSGVIATALLVTLLGGLGQPAWAGAVSGDVLSDGQKSLNEDLSLTPQATQYQGIEYAQTKGTPLGDQEITQKVRQELPSDIKLSVSNGSVRVSGRVSDLNTAQAIVQDIKEIPGVHEVAYDLGLAQ